MKALGASVLAVLALSSGSPIGAQSPPASQTASPQPPRTLPYRRITGPTTYNPGDYPVHWPYPDQYNAVAASPEVHHLRYTDPKIDLVEVAYYPGVQGQMHGHPYASVFAMSAPTPKTQDVRLDPEPGMAPLRSANPAPDGLRYPTCMTMNPQPPHAPTNQDTFPNHFYRLAFKRIDGEAIRENWRAWYPRMLDPPLKRTASKSSAKHSDAWPWPANLDAIIAAPDNYRLLFENEEVRLVEVMLRPGETTPLHGHPYPSVLTFDAVSDAQPTEKFKDPKSTLNGQGAKTSTPMPGFPTLTCRTTPPRAPYTLHNSGKAPIHHYRIEFKRINGDGIRDNWRTWYPWMAKIADETAKHPYIPNY